MDRLLIPCFNRPEFLWHCLDNLTRAHGIDMVHVIFSPDFGYSRDIPTVIQEFAPKLKSYEVRRVPSIHHRGSKQSHNVLSGYMYAATKSSGLVFMVEEDVMVSRDFFDFHRAVHQAEPNLFCSLSTVNHNRKVTTTDHPEDYYLTTDDYCSLGVCFDSRTILDHIAPHIGRPYYSNSGNYCLRTFPNSSIGRGYTEQDGLIRRIQESFGSLMPIAYPHVPRAFHSGFYGYNRAAVPSGKLEWKRDRIGATIYDIQAMSLASHGFNDSEPVNLDPEPWTSLRKKQPQDL